MAALRCNGRRAHQLHPFLIEVKCRVQIGQLRNAAWEEGNCSGFNWASTFPVATAPRVCSVIEARLWPDTQRSYFHERSEEPAARNVQLGQRSRS
jgi:hypothetical protein